MVGNVPDELPDCQAVRRGVVGEKEHLPDGAGERGSGAISGSAAAEGVQVQGEKTAHRGSGEGENFGEGFALGQ